jgi:hypothetical protein
MPLGMAAIFLILLAAALANLMTKTMATVAGVAFAATFLAAFAATEHARRRLDAEETRKERQDPEHLEQFEVEIAGQLTAEALGLDRPYRKVVSVDQAGDLTMLDRCLVESDPESMEIIVVAVHPAATAGSYGDPEHTEVLVVGARTPDTPDPPLGDADRKLMTAVVNRSELAGKPVQPVIILTEDPLSDLLQAVRALDAQELILGPSRVQPSDHLLDQVVSSWQKIADGQHPRLTIRLIDDGRDERRDVGGGSRIPRVAEDEEMARVLAGSGTE